MNWLLAEQVRRNSIAQERWPAYATHRERLNDRLLGMAPASRGRLCILGAGNANDLELARLCRAYREVHLVDIDPDALERGVSRQTGVERSALFLHGGVELTGCWSELAAAARGVAPSSEKIESAIERAVRGPGLDLAGPFDAVASTCVASQLIESAVLALGGDHPRLLELLVAIRTSHLRLLSRMTAPGGRGLLATDFVSSVTLPELAAAAEPDWKPLLERELPRGNFFHGLNPQVLLSLFEADAELAAETQDAQLAGFWRWNQGARIYAVCALEFVRR